MALQSFDDSVTQRFFETGELPAQGCGWKSLASVVARKLDMLHAAVSLLDLRSPPGNQLKKLSGELGAFYSIRINDQWRIIFLWSETGPAHISIIDYH